MTGVKGSILRKVVVDKTRSSLESALASIKRSVEQSAPLADVDARMSDASQHPSTFTQRALKWTIFLAATALVVYLCLLIVRPFLNVIAWSSVLVITFIRYINGSCGRPDACR